MTEVVQVDKIESVINDNDISSAAATIEQQSNENCCSDVLEEEEENSLKNLLSTSTAVTSVAASETTTSAATTAETSVPVESMITKEVNDTQLNLTKILYEPEKGENGKEKEQETTVSNGLTNDNITNGIGIPDTQVVDDDDRLIIDISDDEKKDGHRKRKKPKQKSMPSLQFDDESENKQNQMPKLFSYSFDATSLGVSSSVKIDVLENSSLAIQSNVASSTTTTANEMPRIAPATPLSVSSKYANLSSLDELNLLSHEIDKQITKKTNEVLELAKEFVAGSIESNAFHSRMIEIGNIAMSDLLLISKKLIKRHKFEANPNQRDFMRVKQLQFPTSSKDLVNYFEKLIQSTITMEQFTKMTKFYEIIIKEMLNLNRTKMLQYLIDFMVIRKNAQLDLLNYNFHTDSSPKIKSELATSSTFEIPDSTQNPKSETKTWRMRDTSYNFVIRSDPIYVAAGTPETKYRDMIKHRMTPKIQRIRFQRRPFDNNILKGRRIAGRLVSNKEEEKPQQVMVNGTPPNTNHQNFQHPIQIRINSPVQKVLHGRPIVLTAIPKDDNATIITPIFKPPSNQNSSPILVESDSPPSTSPPLHKIQKPQIISNQILSRGFSERVPTQPVETSAQKNAFPGIFNNTNNKLNGEIIERSAPSIRQPLKRPLSDPKTSPIEISSMDPLEGGQITLNELKTLNQNGTEIIPTSILKCTGNTIRSRRKTVDDRQQIINGGSVEVKKIVAVAPTSFYTSAQQQQQQQQSQIQQENQNQQKKIMRRRQSCHERISNVPSSINNNNLSQSFKVFLNEYEKSREEENMRFNQIRQQQKHMQMQQQQQQSMPLYQQPKRVRFTTEGTQQMEIPRSPQITKSHFAVAQQHMAQQQPRSPIEHPRVYQLSQRSPTMRSPSKAPPIDYQQHLLFFEREMRERGVETLKEHETSRPLELVSNVHPERYMQQLEQTQQSPQSMFTSPKTAARAPEKSPRMQSRVQMVNNEEKMVAYHQLQSLLKCDTSAMNIQQYSEHLKFLHQQQLKAQNDFHHQQQQQQAMEERRESERYYQNTQQMHHQQQQQMQIKSPTAAVPQYRSPPVQSQSDYEQEQSLQRKLISKSKSSKYIEPAAVVGSKPFFNPPHSTYYSDPFVAANANLSGKKSSTPTTPTTPTAFHQPVTVSSPQQSSQLYRNLIEPSPPMNYQQWIFQQHQQAQVQAQAQHNVALPTTHGQLARPIPRPAIPPQPTNMSTISHHALQSFTNPQSEYYRHFFPKSY
ncbi:hypothetical protein PVAND_001583 [Polypedilum vanderplanki]|uniref:Uncharacterized protein n=1 Tax=Polypedilum vanderplanki TaxID=319348 RepID=A0A9J6BPM9_POLVA|nr:hypothetical protein PVAND_001583 [Polypedilum vanderplanki]